MREFRIESVGQLHREIIMGAYTQRELAGKIFEQDQKIKELESQVTKWKQDYENCSKLEKHMSKEHQHCLDNWRETEKENQQLKEEIKQLKFDCAMYKSANYLINAYGIDKAREIMFQTEKKLKQSQNSKAIEVLKQAKIEFETYYADNIWNYPEWIDNQIKELGGEK